MAFTALPSTSLGDYDLGETLGEGTFARIKKATYRDGESVSALKVVKRTLSPKDLKVVSCEVDTMARLCHENVLKLKGPVTREDGSLAALNLELASDDDFFSLIEKGGKMSDGLTRHYFRQMMLALKHCHSRGIAHRDVKLENLLLGEGFRLKLSDFGLAWASDARLGMPPPHMQCKTRTGTISYMAPELFSSLVEWQTFDTSKLDVWSAGVTLFILITGFPPWAEATSKDKFYRLTPRMDTFWRCVQRWAVFTDDAIDLLSSMLDKNAATRASVDDILAHPYCNPESPLSDEEVAVLMENRGHTCPAATQCAAASLIETVAAAEAAGEKEQGETPRVDCIHRFGSAGPSSVASTPTAANTSDSASCTLSGGEQGEEHATRQGMSAVLLSDSIEKTFADITISSNAISKRQSSPPPLPTTATRSTTPSNQKKRLCSKPSDSKIKTEDNIGSEVGFDTKPDTKNMVDFAVVKATNADSEKEKSSQPASRRRIGGRIFAVPPHEQVLP